MLIYHLLDIVSMSFFDALFCEWWLPWVCRPSEFSVVQVGMEIWRPPSPDPTPLVLMFVRHKVSLKTTQSAPFLAKSSWKAPDCRLCISMLECPRYDKSPACPLINSVQDVSCHTQRTDSLCDLPQMYVSFFITTLSPTRPRTNVHINPMKLLFDLARLRGSLFHPSEQRNPAHLALYESMIILHVGIARPLEKKL